MNVINGHLAEKVVYKYSRLWLSMAATGLLGISGQSALAAEAEQTLEEIVVTATYRASLAKALDAKRDAANARESIMAEDIGKMPDLNLAESLQRVAGVAISREGGEGRQITIRGLGPEFTRTTLNGMEVPASTDGLDSSGGLNGGRSFDFNVFASELFNRIDVHKSPSASVEEGGLAGTVELHTARPFDNPGFQAALSGQLGYNDVTREKDPRISGMLSNTFADDTLGVLVSVAKTERTVRQEGFGSVRWTSPTLNGRTWADTSSTEVNGNLAEGTTLDDLWHPRLPRMDYFANEQDRLGATAAFQYRPNDRLDINLDYAYSKFENHRESYNYFAQFRNLQDAITPTELTLDGSGQFIVAGDFNGVRTRSESRLTASDTEFDQIVLSSDYDITDSITLHALVGKASADFQVEQFRFNLSSVPSTFSYDFSKNSDIAEMRYGFDIFDPSFYNFSSPTFQATDVERNNTTVKFDVDIVSDLSTLRLGVIYNKRKVDSLESNITDYTTPTSLDGLTATLPVNDFANGLGVPSGFPTNWLVNNIDATIAAYQLGDWVPDEFDGSTWGVEEQTLGGYVEFDTESRLLSKPLRVNAGLRIVETRADMRGAVADPVDGGFIEVKVDNNYVDVLPSVNVVWELQDDLLMRMNIARNMSRPGLGSLSPTSSLQGLNGTLTGGNPELDPMRADSVDWGLEWYFAKESVLAGTLFFKDIESFIATNTVEKLLDPVYAAIVDNDPAKDDSWVSTSDPWTHSVPLNNEGATLKGIELSYQQPFSMLPAPFNNLGLTSNYMYVDSQSEYGTGSNTVTSDLIGLSKNTANVTLYYETDVYGARLSMNKRNDYLTRVPGRNGNSIEGTSGSTHVDMSAFYNINEYLTLTLEAINLTDEEERLFTDDLDFVREYNHTGRQFFLGVRAAL